MSIIEISHLKKYYGNSRGTEDVTFSVEKGEIFGFVGPNGAGKSTTLKALLNFIFPTDGTASIRGLDVVKNSLEIKRFTAYVPSDVRLYPDMTSEALFHHTLRYYGIRQTDEIGRLTKLFDLDHQKQMRSLSMGNRKKTAILSALLQNPEVILLDEPTNGLDPLIQVRLFDELKRRRAEGTTLLLSSHNLTEIQEYCDRVAFIKSGVITQVIDLKSALVPEKIVTINGYHGFDPLKRLEIKIIRELPDQITFLYQGEPEQLVKALSETSVSDFNVQNRTLEERFMELYQEGEQN